MKIGLHKVYQFFLGFAIIEGIIALFSIFRTPSEAESAFFFGYSFQRIVLGCIAGMILGIFVLAFVYSLGPHKRLDGVKKKAVTFLDNGIFHVIFQTFLIILSFLGIGIVLLYLFPDFQRLLPFIKYGFPESGSTFYSIIDVAWGLVVWISLIALKSIILDHLYENGKKEKTALLTLSKLMVISWIVTGLIFLVFLSWNLFKGTAATDILIGLGSKLLILSVWFSFWAIIAGRRKLNDQNFAIFTGLSIWMVTFLVSIEIAQWLNVLKTPQDNYFNLLADSILHGRISLIDPSTTFDLTFHNGNWFVPFPPFPAVIMLPFIAIWGVTSFNTTVFSFALASTTALFIFFILKELSKHQWIKLSDSGIIWLVALFSFGTVQWWLSVTSRVWHFSQICSVLFCTLAFWGVLKKIPAWVIGIFLAAAILSRPNVIVLWPALVAIKIQSDQDDYKLINWKKAIRWSLYSAIPVIVGVGLLFVYNYLRFGNFLDFGYTTINGSEWTVGRAQTYGIFSPHFISFNLYWMFAAFLPKLIAQCSYYLPRGNGMSIFLATPAFIYILRKFKLSWWTAGCWISILLSIAFLAMYHNNGANQYSYRYIMDFILPVIMLIALNSGEKISIPLKFLIILSILINYYGIISWYKGPC
jgi:hypothetical protein